jgi:hypothetical protein
MVLLYYGETCWLAFAKALHRVFEMKEKINFFVIVVTLVIIFILQ